MPDNPRDGAHIIDIYTRRQGTEAGVPVQLKGEKRVRNRSRPQ